MITNSYWNHKGTHQDVINNLQALIPREGPVTGRKNSKLERLRRAINCYYDLYNNGLCNRAQEFRAIFKIPSSHYRRRVGQAQWSGSFDAHIYSLTEKAMDEIVLAAAQEQGLK